MKNNIIPGEIVGTCDIDYTLLMWGTDTGKTVTFTDPYTSESCEVGVNQANLRVFTNWLTRGATMLVWSRSGMLWAKAALRALGIEHERIHVIGKPQFHIDDKPCTEWMGERVDLPHHDKWGRGKGS